jgi:5-formyltetrahydrofolate cyclo-ligase
MDPRRALRNKIREQRRALSAHDVKRYSEQLAQHFSTSNLFRNAKHIAFYLANDGELDVYPLMQIAWAMNKRCYLPILSPPFQRHLFFAQYNHGDPLALNEFAIPEPDVGPRHFKKAKTLDLVLTPLVACDSLGNRLGMGGGFYDRTFHFLKHRTQWQKPRLVGVAYDFQQVEALEFQPWDVPLAAVATPGSLMQFKTTR